VRRLVERRVLIRRQVQVANEPLAQLDRRKRGFVQHPIRVIDVLMFGEDHDLVPGAPLDQHARRISGRKGQLLAAAERMREKTGRLFVAGHFNVHFDRVFLLDEQSHHLRVVV
jgi:hypothetical protein